MKKQYGILSIPVIVAALGYFVDIYDLLLFSITRIESLRSFGLSPEADHGKRRRYIDVADGRIAYRWHYLGCNG